jgi:hypothetical protein
VLGAAGTIAAVRDLLAEQDQRNLEIRRKLEELEGMQATTVEA